MAVVSPNTTIKFLSVPIEIDQKNQLTFATASAQLTYFNGLSGSISISNCTYQRKEGFIRVPRSFDTLQIYNYVMYQNGSSGKWYFCFIENMEFLNDEVTKVYIKTDVWQTYQFDITFKKCFVEREHVNNDAVGLHTLPENVELGEYICNSHTKDTTMDSYSSDLCMIMATPYEDVVTPGDPEAEDPELKKNHIEVAPSRHYNGIYTGLTYYRFDSGSALDPILELYAKYSKTEAINGIFMAPKWLSHVTTLNIVDESNAPLTFDTTTAKQTTLNGYTPKNNKLKTFPYNFLIVSNNIGQNAILHYEKFSNTNCTFTVKGVINPGCSINITPTNYNGSTSSDIDAIQLGKFPICNFQNDMYTNWLTQNSINVLGTTISTDDINVASSVLGAGSGIATGLATGNPLGVGLGAMSGAQGIAGALIQKKQHSMIPTTVSGSLNSADVNVASGNNTFHYYKMSIKAEYAQIIDEYFTMYGYQVNSLKLPNRTGRTNWNYVKTLECNIVGNIPDSDLVEIKSIFNNGVTLWHNPLTFLDYSQTNSIVS